MNKLKITITCLMLLIFSTLLCCTILSWENLITTEKKEFTQAEMLASYELGRTDEKANSENTINDLIVKQTNLQLRCNEIENEKLKLESQIEILENSNLNQKNTIQELNNQITILTNEKEELYAQIRELNTQMKYLRYELDSYKQLIQNSSTKLYSRVEIYDVAGNSIAVDFKNYTSELLLPSTLPDGTVVNEWIVEYTTLNPADWLDHSFVCEVMPAGTALNLYTSSLKLKAVVGEVYDVYFLDQDKLLYQTKACANSKITYDCISHSSYSYYLYTIAEEIDSQWITSDALNEDYRTHNINYNTKFAFGIPVTFG